MIRQSVSKSEDTAVSLVLIVISLLMVFEVNLVGRLNAADVSLIALLPFLLVRNGRMLKEPLVRRILIAAGVWFLSQVITDMIRQSPSEDLVRGWAKIAVFSINFMSLCLLTRLRYMPIVVLIVGTAVASAIKVYLGVGDLMFLQGDFAGQWKYAYGSICSLLCLLVSGWLSARSRGTVKGLWMPYASSAFALYMNARTLFGVTGISAVLATIIRPGRTLPRRTQITYAVGGIVAAVLLVNIYSMSASNGLLGTDAQDKYIAQSQNPAGLLSGRAEIFSSSQAIIDSPLIGHGSWARDSRYADLMRQRLMEMGVQVEVSFYEGDLIPTHSHLLGAWVEAGLLGAVFWGIVLWTVVGALLAAIRYPDYFIGFTAFVCCNFIWTILFSPFGNDLRVIDAGWLCLIVSTINSRAAVPRNSIRLRQMFLKRGLLRPVAESPSI